MIAATRRKNNSSLIRLVGQRLRTNVELMHDIVHSHNDSHNDYGYCIADIALLRVYIVARIILSVGSFRGNDNLLCQVLT